MENTYVKIYITIVTVLILIVFFRWQNNDLVISKIKYKNSKLPQAFNNYRVVHISDLHNKKFGRNQSILVKKVSQEDPDIIFITGDLVDRRRYYLKPATDFIKQAVQIAPVYYVAGNHESFNDIYKEVKPALESLGVTILDNKKVSIKKGKSIIDIIGLLDEDFYVEKDLAFIKHLNSFSNLNNFTILLSHRPNKINEYSRAKMDLAAKFAYPLLGDF